MKNKTRFSLLVTTALIAFSLILSACGASSPSTNPDGSVNVNVTLTDFGIEFIGDRVRSWDTYRFHITNEGQLITNCDRSTTYGGHRTCDERNGYDARLASL